MKNFIKSQEQLSEYASGRRKDRKTNTNKNMTSLVEVKVYYYRHEL